MLVTSHRPHGHRSWTFHLAQPPRQLKTTALQRCQREDFCLVHGNMTSVYRSPHFWKCFCYAIAPMPRAVEEEPRGTKRNAQTEGNPDVSSRHTTELPTPVFSRAGLGIQQRHEKPQRNRDDGKWNEQQRVPFRVIDTLDLKPQRVRNNEVTVPAKPHAEDSDNQQTRSQGVATSLLPATVAPQHPEGVATSSLLATVVPQYPEGVATSPLLATVVPQHPKGVATSSLLVTVVPQHPEGVATSSLLATVIPQHPKGVATSSLLATVVPQHPEGVATSMQLATVDPQHPNGVATSMQLATVVPQHPESVATSSLLATVVPKHPESVATSLLLATVVPQHPQGIATSSLLATVVPQYPEGVATSPLLATVVPQHPIGVATSSLLVTVVPQHPEGVATSSLLATFVPQHPEGVATSSLLATVVPQHPEGVATSMQLATVDPQHPNGIATSMQLATVVPQHPESVATSSLLATVVPIHSESVATSSLLASVVPQHPEGIATSMQLATVDPQHPEDVATSSQLTTVVPQHPDVATSFSNPIPGSDCTMDGGHERYRKMREGNVQETSSAPYQLNEEFGHRMHAAQADSLEYNFVLMNSHLTTFSYTMDQISKLQQKASASMRAIKSSKYIIAEEFKARTQYPNISTPFPDLSAPLFSWSPAELRPWNTAPTGPPPGTGPFCSVASTSSPLASVVPQHPKGEATSSQLTTVIPQHPDMATSFNNPISGSAGTMDGGDENFCRMMEWNVQGTSIVPKQLNEEFGHRMHAAQTDVLEYNFMLMNSHLTTLSYTMDQISTLQQQASSSMRAIESSKYIIAEEFKARTQYPNISTPFPNFSTPLFSWSPAELRPGNTAPTGPPPGTGPFCSIASTSSPLTSVVPQHPKGEAASSQLTTVIPQHPDMATSFNNLILGSAGTMDGGDENYCRMMEWNVQGTSIVPKQLNEEFGHRMHAAQTDVLEYNFMLINSHLTTLSYTMDQISSLQQEAAASMRAIKSSKYIIAEEFEARR
ncbi:uncharacterized protein LOC135053761 [Pseudophryne corroboree]|uniref:uncharacterized protein LOC135053761 n=1 Tax=Pseudophryne corroboree TaxID=495146 RepID=UPI0030819897